MDRVRREKRESYRLTERKGTKRKAVPKRGMKNDGQHGLAIPDVACCNEHRLLALLAGDAVHGELGDVVTAVGVHFRELGRAGDCRSEALSTGVASFTSSSDHPACCHLQDTISPPFQTLLQKASPGYAPS